MLGSACFIIKGDKNTYQKDKFFSNRTVYPMILEDFGRVAYLEYSTIADVERSSIYYKL